VLSVLALLLVAHVVAAFRGGGTDDRGGDGGHGEAPLIRPRGEVPLQAPSPGEASGPG
jgi:hypothetical protein